MVLTAVQALGGNGGALMMQQIRTLRAVANGYNEQASIAEKNGDPATAYILYHHAAAFDHAAREIDAEDRAAYAPAAGKAVAE